MNTMSRKLKRKIKKKDIVDPIEKKPVRIKRYKKQKCVFVDENGRKCNRLAVGKSTLCKKHGGNPVIKENLLPDSVNNILTLATKYKPEEHPILFIEYSRMGMSEVEIAAEFMVSVETMRGWSEKFEMFNRAHEIGKALHESWWLLQGKSGLNNRGFNTGLYKFLTANKLGYAEKMETKSMNMNIHGVLMVPDKVSEEEWENDDEDIIDVNP
jgi:hypothetical protein